MILYTSILYYFAYRYEEIVTVKSIYTPSIVNDQSIFFLKTQYRNISFNQCIRSKDRVSDIIKNTKKWKECQDIFDIWNLSINHGIFVDIGANIGSCSFIFAEIGVKVYAFEPLPNNLFLFSLTVFTNHKFKEYITIFPYALGKQNTNQVITVYKHNWGASSLYKNNGDYEERISVKKLDDFEKLIPNKVSMIKIDVENGEYNLLEGGKYFFQTHKSEYMYIETSCGKRYGNGLFEVEKLYKILNNMGYDVIRKINCKKYTFSNIVAKIKK